VARAAGKPCRSRRRCGGGATAGPGAYVALQIKKEKEQKKKEENVRVNKLIERAMKCAKTQMHRHAHGHAHTRARAHDCPFGCAHHALLHSCARAHGCSLGNRCGRHDPRVKRMKEQEKAAKDAKKNAKKYAQQQKEEVRHVNATGIIRAPARPATPRPAARPFSISSPSRACVQAHAHTYARRRARAHARTHTRARTHAHTHADAHTHAHTHSHTRMRKWPRRVWCSGAKSNGRCCNPERDVATPCNTLQHAPRGRRSARRPRRQRPRRRPPTRPQQRQRCSHLAPSHSPPSHLPRC
jgi:hypothetical protein